MRAGAFHLQRFIAAQTPVYNAVKTELLHGEKTTHWMWFIFPQIGGLGISEMARRYAIRDRVEAASYIAHPILGRRLIECTAIVNDLEGNTAEAIFGNVDALKFHSCMTLFTQVAAAGSPFEIALVKYFAGRRDEATMGILGRLSRRL